MDITTSRNANLVDAMKSVRLAMYATSDLDSASVSQTLPVNTVKSARMDSSTIPLVHIATVTAAERWTKFATKATDSACVGKVTEDPVVISAFLATTTTRIAFPVTAREREAYRRFVM